MNSEKITLLQCLVCENFQPQDQDGYSASGIRSNLYVSHFPYSLSHLNVVTCWRKDERFHKEVIEYRTDEGLILKSPHMDIEPIRDSVLFRWHTHRFPPNLLIEKPTILWIRVMLDWEPHFESYLLIEKAP